MDRVIGCRYLNKIRGHSSLDALEFVAGLRCNVSGQGHPELLHVRLVDGKGLGDHLRRLVVTLSLDNNLRQLRGIYCAVLFVLGIGIVFVGNGIVHTCGQHITIVTDDNLRLDGLSGIDIAVFLKNFDADASVLAILVELITQPLSVEGNIFRDGIIDEVPFVNEGFIGVPTAEGIALLNKTGGFRDYHTGVYLGICQCLVTVCHIADGAQSGLAIEDDIAGDGIGIKVPGFRGVGCIGIPD